MMKRGLAILLLVVCLASSLSVLAEPGQDGGGGGNSGGNSSGNDNGNGNGNGNGNDNGGGNGNGNGNGNGGDGGNGGGPPGPSPVIEGVMTLDPDTRRLGGLVPVNEAARSATLNEYLNQNFGELIPDPGGAPAAVVAASRLNDHAVIRVFLRDVDPNAPPFGSVEGRFQLPGGIDRCRTSSSSGVCVFAYRIGSAPPVFLTDPTGSTTPIGALNASFTPAFQAVIILRNLDSTEAVVDSGDLRFRVSSGQTVSNDFPIRIGGVGTPVCRLTVTGAIGEVYNKSCTSASCTPDAETLVQNAGLKFRAVLDGLPTARSQIKAVSFSGGPNAQGEWMDAPVNIPSTVVATVTTSTNVDVFCALTVRPVGVAFRLKVARASTCELFKALREYYLLDTDGTPMGPNEGYNNCQGLSIPGLKTPDGEPFSYGRCEAPPRNNPTFTQGPGLPFAGVLNFGVDTTGFVEIGVGGNVVIPPIENRQFAGAVLTVSVYNEEAPDSNSAFERPAYYAVVPSTGDMSALAMIPTSPDVTIPGDARVMFRLFLARSIREGGSIERRGSGLTCRNGDPCPELWSFDPVLGDLIVPFMDDSCMAVGQVSPPLRNDKEYPLALSTARLCLNSKPYPFSAVSNGRLTLKALSLSPEHPWHEFPTNLLRRNTSPAGCDAGPGAPVRECWNFSWSSLPPNLGESARQRHNDCVKWVLVNTTVVQYDRYGRPYNVTVPTWVREFQPSCPVLEVSDECSAGLAVRFNGYAMMRAAALGCAQKYHMRPPANRDLSNAPIAATLPNQGILPYNVPLGGSEPKKYTDYPGITEGYGCIPCRIDATSANTATMPLDQDNRYPIFSFARERAPSSCVQDATLEVRYFGSSACTGSTFPEGHFCSSENIDGRICPGFSENEGSRGTFSGSGNVAGKFTVPLCPGAGLPFDDVALSWSPLILDLSGSGIRVSRSFEEAVYFDIKGTGTRVAIDWPLDNHRVAFLVRPEKGRVDSIKHLFGDYRAKNGFEALRRLDSNKDNLIDRKDREWKTLALWFDRNRNGESDAGELAPLAAHGVEAIYLDYFRPGGKEIEGKMLSGVYFNREANEFRNIADVFFYEYLRDGKRITQVKPAKKASGS